MKDLFQYVLHIPKPFKSMLYAEPNKYEKIVINFFIILSKKNFLNQYKNRIKLFKIHKSIKSARANVYSENLLLGDFKSNIQDLKKIWKALYIFASFKERVFYVYENAGSLFFTFLYIGFIFDFEYFMKSNFLGHSQAISKDLFLTNWIFFSALNH